MFITSIRFFSLARKKENQIEKQFNNIFGYSFLFFGISLIFLVLSFFYIKGTYIDHVYWGNLEDRSVIYEWLVRYTTVSNCCIWLLFNYKYEKIFNLKRHIVSITIVIVIILTLILPYELAAYQILPIAWVLLAMIYLHRLFKLVKFSEKELRATTSMFIIGIIFLGWAMALAAQTSLAMGLAFPIIVPTLFIIGTIFCIIPTILKPELFSHKMSYWYIFSIIIIVPQIIFMLLFVFLFQLPIEYFLLGISFAPLYTLECIYAIKSVKSGETFQSEEKIDVGGIFSKPKRITEEEVSISKEKKICLVCKGNLARKVYICPDCGTFYCNKCSDTLSNLENACWVCNVPFDESKPVKPFKEETVEVESQRK